MIEVEIKAKIDDLNIIKDLLEKLGAKYIGTKKQVDMIFGNPKFLDENSKIIEGGLVARIRRVDNTSTLEFKEINRLGGGIELESEIPNTEIGAKFLEKLDFKESFTIDKQRQYFEYEGCKVQLDNVKDLGEFIEIEKIIDNELEIENARQECIKLLEKISPDATIINEKYGDLIQDKINKSKN